MADVVSENKECVVVEKKVGKTTEPTEKVAVEETEVAKNGDAVTEVEKNGDAVEETKSQNEEEETNKSVENGDVKANDISEAEESKDDTDSVEARGIKRKSEVGLESEEATDDAAENFVTFLKEAGEVESPEKKQKLERMSKCDK